MPDGADQCLNTPKGERVNDRGCGWSQLDDDADGVPNGSDDCPATFGVSKNGCPVTVTPTSPSFDGANRVVRIPSDQGVVYYLNGKAVKAGTYRVSGTVSVKALPVKGYRLNGTTEWSYRFVSKSSSRPGFNTGVDGGSDLPLVPLGFLTLGVLSLAVGFAKRRRQ